MRLPFLPSTPVYLVLGLLTGFLASCSNSTSSSSNAATTVTATGTVVAAPIAGASLSVKDSAGNLVAGPVVTAADGSYSIDIAQSDMTGMLIFEASGGSYRDEASGQTINATRLQAVLDYSSANPADEVHLTPASTIVHDLVVTHGLSLTQASDNFRQAFGYDADTRIQPVDAVSPPAGASDASLLAGLRAASFSQLTADLGLAADQQFTVLAALAEDLADGALDGNGTAGAVAISAGTMMPADIHNRYSSALIGFYDSTGNQTGLANDQIGQPAFATVALSPSYRVEYVAGMMQAMEGKTDFSLRVTDNNTGAAVSGLAIQLMPMMHMASGMMHSSPTVDCTESANAGVYSCTVYYLMASSMMNGMPMGYWELNVMMAMNEAVTFYPRVMMAMGDTPRVTLKGQSDDMIAGMLPENRSYLVFKQGLTGSNNSYSFSVLVAAKESMMSFPVVGNGTILNSGDAQYELTVNNLQLDVSVDKVNWMPAVASGNAWTVSGLALTANVSNDIYIRLAVNGVTKTSDGLAADGSNDIAVFSVTPSAM